MEISKHHSEVISSLERYVYPAIGNVSLSEITSPVILVILKRVETKKAIGDSTPGLPADQCHIPLYGIACGIAQTASAFPLKRILQKVPKGRQKNP
ncbi:hypothetical protein NQF87_01750 [Bombella sp. TMW 2.2559]|uniref:Phage integrase central domain-containing protein n=1 Tax=Bombella dulcis TaxID=2967339 RepID=A0ABT3WBQ2_9PROT|nr:hypothetical protein [Bombella dulcis]MCX5615705.1 hypothetical protein [Bombella dulcis]